ncbi:MAG: hypothetical protein QXO40_05470 [Candidatus Aenigmatarchaeota archaeon]
MYKTYIACLICKKTFECNIKDSATKCAKKHKMKKIKVGNLNGFVCEECYFKLLE